MEFKVLETMSIGKFQKLMGGGALEWKGYEWTNPDTGKSQLVRHLLCGGDRVGVISRKVEDPLDDKLLISNIQFEDGDIQWVLHEDKRNYSVGGVIREAL